MKKIIYYLFLLPLFIVSCSSIKTETLKVNKITYSKLSFPVDVKIVPNTNYVSVEIINNSDKVLEIDWYKCKIDKSYCILDSKYSKYKDSVSNTLIAPHSKEKYTVFSGRASGLIGGWWTLGTYVQHGNLEYPTKFLLKLTLGDKTEYKVVDIDARIVYEN